MFPEIDQVSNSLRGSAHALSTDAIRVTGNSISAVPSFREISNEEVIKFNNILESPNTAEPNPVELNSMEIAETPSALPGDKILESLKNTSQHYIDISNKVKGVFQMKSAESLSMAKILQTQMLVTEYSIFNDLLSKVADKTSQGVQTLLRNQG
ncbi:MAG: hypothetical protein A2007_02015 [Verrucomicrobia bacterium GWC2_42_7]|nr:MAG: hypothetical protein A2007_02015 [Verrucomicrobia bacterium GWC2_42_7]